MNAIPALGDKYLHRKKSETMIGEATTEKLPAATMSDPTDWVDRHGDYLFAYAAARVGGADRTTAEDLVQETLLAAWQSAGEFSGKSCERTWLTGILKHKIIDYYRRNRRKLSFEDASADFSDFDEFFKREDEWNGHWNERFAPVEWRDTPEYNLEQVEFRGVLSQCLSKLPEREAFVFTMREMDGLTSGEICDALAISANNFWVIIHRARMNLRRCIEIKWFRQVAK